MYGIEVTFNGMISLLNFIKIYQLVKKLLGGGTHRQTDRQTGDLISFTFLLKESRLIKVIKAFNIMTTSRLKMVAQPTLETYRLVAIRYTLENNQYPT
jgi:hypothetical protein